MIFQLRGFSCRLVKVPILQKAADRERAICAAASSPAALSDSMEDRETSDTLSAKHFHITISPRSALKTACAAETAVFDRVGRSQLLAKQAFPPVLPVQNLDRGQVVFCFDSAK